MTKRVMLLLADGFEPLEAAGFTDVFGWANIDGDEPIELVAVGTANPLTPTFGCRVIPDAHIGNVNPGGFDAVAIPGGFAKAGYYDHALSEPFQAVLRAFAGRDRPVASVCVASIPMGAAGLLAGRRATVYHQVGGTRRAELEAHGAQFVDEAVVIDGNIITSTGPGTAIEVALALLAMLTSKANADNVRHAMRVPQTNQAWLKTAQVVDTKEML